MIETKGPSNHLKHANAVPGGELTIAADQAQHYSIVETSHVFDPEDVLGRAILSGVGRVLVVVDSEVWALYEAGLSDLLSLTAPDHEMLLLPGGEEHKTLEQALAIVAAMDRCHTLRRSSLVVGIGGGVVCDLVGFAAGIYRRGVPYLRVPTTLLSQVDVSVAIKTGVNHGGYRNRLGAFWPPVLTVLDRSFLATQSRIGASYGLGEVFKLALIKSLPLFELLEQLPAAWTPAWLTTDALAAAMIRLAVTEMAEELRDNLWEDELARCVDFGHSFSPMIEMETGLHHGHAVALDCLLSACLATRRNLLTPDELQRVLAVMRLLQLPTFHPSFTEPSELWSSLLETTKHRDGHQHLPLPTSIGAYTFIEDLTYEELESAIPLMIQIGGGDAR